MSFSKMKKKQLTLNEQAVRMNPFQIMEQASDNIANLSFRVSQLYEIENNLIMNGLDSESEAVKHVQFTIQLFQGMIKMKNDRLATYALKFATENKSNDKEQDDDSKSQD